VQGFFWPLPLRGFDAATQFPGCTDRVSFFSYVYFLVRSITVRKWYCNNAQSHTSFGNFHTTKNASGKTLSQTIHVFMRLAKVVALSKAMPRSFRKHYSELHSSRDPLLFGIRLFGIYVRVRTRHRERERERERESSNQ
jgi:hypothetical protein